MYYYSNYDYRRGCREISKRECDAQALFFTVFTGVCFVFRCCVFANMNLATTLKTSAQNGIMKFGEPSVFFLTTHHANSV